MPQLLFQFQSISGKDGPVLETLVRMLNQRKLKYDGIQKKGDSVIGVDFVTPEDAKSAYKNLDGMEFMGSVLVIKPGRSSESREYNGRYSPASHEYCQDDDAYSENKYGKDEDKYGKEDKHNYNSDRHVEQYPCRILIPSDMVKVILGKAGATITSIQTKTNTKIDIHRDKGLTRGHPGEDTLTSIKGEPDAFSEAVKEILTVMDKEYEKRTYEDRRPLQLKLLAHDLLCGRIIGKGGNNLKQVRNESNVTKLIISNSIYDEGNQFVPNGLLCTGERVITTEGSLESICAAEKILSERLRDYMERDMRSSTNNMAPPMQIPYYNNGGYSNGGYSNGGYSNGGYNNDGYNCPPQFYQRSPYGGYNNQQSFVGGYGQGGGGGGGYGQGGGGGGYTPMNYMNGGSYPGMLANQYPPYSSNLVPQPVANNSDLNETSCIIIPTKEVGAVIGRNGGYISRVKQYSGARVRVVKGEEGGESRVEVTGPPDSQWRASLCIFNKIKETIKVPYSETQLKTEYMVPGSCVGRIIGKKGQVVQDIQDKSQADIDVPKEQQGDQDVPVYVSGTFNGTQIAVNRIRDIIHRAHTKSS